MEAITKIAGVVGISAVVGAGSALVLSTPAQAQGASAQQAPAAEQVAAEQVGQASVELPVVEGTFSYAQAQISSAEQLAQVAQASKYICQGEVALADDEAGALDSADVADWSIAIGGEVNYPAQFTIGELQESPVLLKQIMGCTCAANPADGRASANAEVTGVAMTTLLSMAGGATEEANTIVFESADGYTVALPLSYVTSRYAPIVFNVNGSPLAQSMGGANQLWLGGTAARYFARDIVSITLESRDVVPAAPDSDEVRDEYANLPNVGVYFGGSVA